MDNPILQTSPRRSRRFSRSRRSRRSRRHGVLPWGVAFPVAAFVSFPLPLPAPRCKPLSVQPLVRLAQARARACALALACCVVPPGAPAQEPAPPAPLTPSTPSTAPVPPDLRTTPRLQEKIPQALQPQLPVFVQGDRISGQTDLHTLVEGDAALRRGDTVIRADQLDYRRPEDLARARGRVRLNRAGNLYEGQTLQLQVETFQGFFDDVRYRFLATQAHGTATRVDFLDRDRSVVHNATYTTCERRDLASQPDWLLRAATLHIDEAQQVGSADDAVLEFKGWPLLPIPHISFPLSDQRKSGLLPPTVGLDRRDGLSYSQPYYWNIAPNRDATLNAALMTERGASLGLEWRYLEPSYHGQINTDLMPYDRLRQRSRWSLSGQHQGRWDTGIGALGLSLGLYRVSDDNYWRDFSRVATSLRQRLLPADAVLSWARNDMSATLRTLQWQTLQDVTAPIVPPYDRMPQLQWRYAPTRLGGGLDASLELDATRFEAARALTGQPNANRSYALAQISRPFLAPQGFITPRLQWHATRYQFDAPLVDGARSASRALPTFSLDSGLVFERGAAYLGRNFLQTLEPRAFYTYTPYRDQSRLPVYDTAANDFNFATVYTENAFGGNDRLADNHLLTLGLSTRLLAPDTGAEAARLGIAQRLRFSDQKVTLPGDPQVSERLSDLLLGAGISWTPGWGLDSTVQYNPKTRRSIRTTLGAHYSPGSYRTVSAAYRLQRGTSEQIDVGWQWPLNDLWGDKGLNLGPGRGQGGGRWYSVGRLNYSLHDRRLVDTVAGLEYDGCCWIGRVLIERLQSGLTSANARLLFQIEFLGLSRLSLGASPLDSFKQNVPGYRNLREQMTTPSRFSNYD
ncbi:LPS-assembly protein LptD [Verminephrobacter eiseniae]|uniref:LPS-assembly protein LptD n=2 Tax=Verminephrobacter eiseniae TaxID=364317 RepID=A1WS97_VEREI|nr:Organic solvent tolerance protein [Verminephrobacter eiseniae EF01-2]MCW5285980.1 LPS-assembly protein LptD [Verminephrobacter eiseniae]MCW5304278.1 LPS-assembly protein LptD [Verminephrobacter eiseniae]